MLTGKPVPSLEKKDIDRFWSKVKITSDDSCWEWTDSAGALGITVCQEWLNSFPKFIEDMGDRPSLDHSIDRIENSKGYYKENCRWATKLEQANNKTINRKLVYRGISKNLSEWCRFLEIDRDLFKQQLNRDGREMEYCVVFGIVNKFKKSRTTLNVNKCQ